MRSLPAHVHPHPRSSRRKDVEMTNEGQVKLLTSCMFADGTSRSDIFANSYRTVDENNQCSITTSGGATVTWSCSLAENVEREDGGECRPVIGNSRRPKVQRNLRKARKPVVHYRHVPHREKPPQIVERRNARERRRVQAVNCAFSRLRKVVPIENARGKRVSKVKTLHRAIDYIRELQEMLLQSDKHLAVNLDINKENSKRHWNIIDSSMSVKWNQPNSIVQYLEEYTDEFY